MGIWLDLRRQPIEERKAKLAKLLRRAALRELHGRPMPERIVAGMEADAATHQGRGGVIRQDAA